MPLEPTAEALREAVARSGTRDAARKQALQIERNPYPSPAYRVLLPGPGTGCRQAIYARGQLGGNDPIAALKREHVAFVVLKRYNRPDPATLPFLAALAREGRRIAVFSPYPQTETRRAGWLSLSCTTLMPGLSAALERPGPVVEIWQIDGPGS